MKNLAAAAALILIASSSVEARAIGFNAASASMSNDTTSTAPQVDQSRYGDWGRNVLVTATKLAMSQPVEPAATPSSERYAGGEAKSVAGRPGSTGSGGDDTGRVGPARPMPRSISPDELNWMQGGGG